jgi:hypothetical protein
MSFARFLVASLLFSALSLTCGQSVAGDLDQQIAERARLYQESLRQRAAQVSPSFQAKIESQTRNAVAKGLEQWKKGEISIQIVLPHWAESQRIAQFVARHLPGSPPGSPEWNASNGTADLTVSSVKLVMKSLTISAVHFTSIRSVVYPFRQSSESISYFVRIVSTIVQRR